MSSRFTGSPFVPSPPLPAPAAPPPHPVPLAAGRSPRRSRPAAAASLSGCGSAADASDDRPSP